MIPLAGTRPALTLDFCQVDAAGVPAEWVEATVATLGQLTIVYFSTSGNGDEALAASRRSAGDLAAATGARVLTVGCATDGARSQAVAVARGVTAFRWLLGEGCDVKRTTFTHDSAGAPLVEAILTVAQTLGLPLPTASASVSVEMTRRIW